MTATSLVNGGALLRPRKWGQGEVGGAHCRDREDPYGLQTDLRYHRFALCGLSRGERSPSVQIVAGALSSSHEYYWLVLHA